jgi:hypothetical protein
MNITDVANLLFAARERIDFYWNFYVVVVVAIIGWLMSSKRTLTRPMKALVSIAYVIASTLNLVGLYSSYTFAEALRLDMLDLAATTSLTDTRLFLEQHSYLPQRLAAIATHLVVGGTILAVVWFARFSDPETTGAQTAPAAPAKGARQRRGQT